MSGRRAEEIAADGDIAGDVVLPEEGLEYGPVVPFPAYRFA